MNRSTGETIQAEIYGVPPLQPRSEHDGGSCASLPPCCENCAEVLHALADAFAGVLINAQAMDWKLPSYSRSKRYIHEIERNSQRGTELLKRLRRQLATHGYADRSGAIEASSEAGLPLADPMALVASQEPSAVEHGKANLLHASSAMAASVFGPVPEGCSHRDVTHALARNSQKGTISTKAL